ncbi:MAG: hypothetical protein Q8L90_10765 [Bacteroidota bacterium]|nr:hypothetical protein [Bacteroidota bacterium]
MITTKKRNLNRLLKLARYMGKQYLHNYFICGNYTYCCYKADCDVEHFSWLLSELPNVFNKQWSYKDEETPCLIKYEKLNSLAAVAVFFNLTGDELFHLFVPAYQDPTYEGKELSRRSTPSDLINNIYQFILYKENKLNKPELIELENYKTLVQNKYHHEYPGLSKTNNLSKLSA